MSVSMERIIIEVGSTVTKIDKYDGQNIRHLGTRVIEFKRNYKKDNKLNCEDINTLIDLVKQYQKDYSDIYVCGTSIFRILSEQEKEEFLDKFQKETNIDFEIISQKRENELTVFGATKNVNDTVAVFVGGGGSTEIAIYENGIREMVNTEFGVMDVMEIIPDLADDLATTDIEVVKKTIKEKLNIPKQKVDTLILAGGAHLLFVLEARLASEENTLYKDELHPLMQTMETRVNETRRYYEEISLDYIRSQSNDPYWWYATRAMMVYGLVE